MTLRKVSKVTSRLALALTICLLVSAAVAMHLATRALSSNNTVKPPISTTARREGSAAVTVRAAGRGKQFFNFQDGRRVAVSYRGDASATQFLQSGQARPRAMASAVLANDAIPNLISGYSGAAMGVVTVQHGNPEAFAPKDESVYPRIQQGYNPDPLLPGTDTYLVPQSVDFLQVGDFNHDGRKDVLTAARGGDLFLLAGDGRGGLDAAVQIPLPGKVTALAAGEFRAIDGWTDLAVSVDTPSGPMLLIFDGANALSGELTSFPLKAAATAMQFADLDHDPFQDLAVAAGDQVIIIHGWSRNGADDPNSRVERISEGYEVRDLAVGFFIWNRKADNQIAVLASDGAVRILDGGSDTRPYTPEEAALFQRRNIHKTSDPVDVESLPGWQQSQVGNWKSVRQVSSGASLAADPTSRKVLSRAKLSFEETDELLIVDSSSRQLNIIRQGGHTDLVRPGKGQSSVQSDVTSQTGDLTTTPLDTTAGAIAVQEFPQKINGERSLFVMQEGSVSQDIVPQVVSSPIVVDRTDDISPIPAGCDTAVANDCSLRGAVQAANANPGRTINIPAGTYTLTINGTASTGCEGNSVGDLGINASTTIVGAGSASTIIRQHGLGAAGTAGDRVICLNETVANSIVYTISAVTIIGGRDSSTWTAGGIIGGGHLNSLTLNNVVIANNQASNSGTVNTGGGGIQIVGGPLIINNSTIGGSSAPTTFDVTNSTGNRDSTTAGNKAGVSGGGINFDPSSGTVVGTVGNLTVTSTTFNNNVSSSAAGGGGGVDINNAGFGSGGGGSGTMTFDNCTFSNNQATGAANTGSGGAINIESLNATINATSGATSFTSNSATNKGGAISNGGGALTIDGTSANGITFSSNTATNGGSSIFTNNTATLIGTNTTVGGSILVATNGNWTNNAGSAISPTDFSILGGTVTCNNSTMNVTGNFTIGAETTKGGILNANTGTINIQGNLSVNLSNGGSGAAGQFNAGTGSFVLNGSGAQSISNSGTGTPITFNNLTDSNITQPLTINNSFNVNGTLNVNGANAIFDPVAAAVIGGSGTLQGSGTARVRRTAATADFLSQYTITNKTLTSLTVEYIGGAAQVLSATTYGPLKINNASGVSLSSGTATVNSTLTLTAGALAVGAGTTLNINAGSSVGGGSLTSNATGTVVYGQTSNGQSVIGANYGNLTFSNFNKVLPATVGVAGTFTPGSATGHTISGNTFDFNGASTQSVAAFNYNNLTISGNRGLAQVTLAPATIGVAGTFNPSATNVVYVKTNNTFDFNGASTQSVAAFNYNNLTISGNRGGATVTLASGTVGIAGVFNPSATSVVFATTGNTVEYNGSSAQTMPSSFTTYNNLSLNNAAGVTPFAGLTVNGLLRVQAGTFTSNSGTYKDVQIDSGTTLAGTNATTINVGGGWTNNGTFTHNTNTLNFNGASAQLIGGTSATTFNNLTINNITTVTVSNGGNAVDATVAGLLTLTTDLTVAASAVLQQSGTSGGASDVIGTVRRTDLGLTARAFGNPFNTITIDSGTAPTSFDATLVKSAPIDFTGAVKRTYTLTPTGGAGFSATLKLHYLDADLNGNTEANLGLWQKSAATWISRGRTGSVDTANNAVTLSGVTSFSDWTLAAVPDVSVSVSPSSVKEDGATNLVYTFTRNGNTTAALTINFNVGGDATFNTDYTQSGADTFTSSSGTVTFTAGSSTATVTIDPTTDTDQENNETVILTVVSGGNYNAGSPNAATGTINNDETTTTITSDNPDPSNSGQAVAVNYTVTAPNGTPTGNVLVSDSVDSNTCTVAAGTCSLSLTTTGARTITATYQGDSNFNSSADTENHTVCSSSLVTTAADSGAGSLRQILTDVCDGATITFDTAGVFSTPQTISLATLLSDLNKNLTITGPGVGQLTVRRDPGAGTNFRIFKVAAGKTVTISGLTISGGNLSNNGGAIWNDHGTLTLNNVDLTGNTATGGGGGAIYNDATAGGTATLTVINSLIRSNTAAAGGGLYNDANGAGTATLNLVNSTVSGNSVTNAGGGLYSEGTGGTANVRIHNATITKNTADSDNDNSGTGGGISLVAASVILRSTIVAGNLNGDGGPGTPDDLSGTVDTANSVNNLVGDAATAGGLTNGVNGNIVGNAGAGTLAIASILNPTLANNGGPTQTHALVFGSLAIEAGTDVTTLNGGIDNVTTSVTVTDSTAIPANVGLVIRIDDEQMTVTSKVGNVLTVTRAANATTAASHLTGAAVNPAFDQRGLGFLRKADSADVNTTQTVDIGAFECQATVQDITDKSTPQDTPLSFSFNVGDAGQISSVTASSANATLVPNLPANINVTGAGSTRDLNITPASGQTGTSIITVTVSAGSENMSDTFVLTVNAPADAPSMTNATTIEDTQTSSGLVITRGANQGPEFAFFKISIITNGTLFKNDGVTPISNNQTITEAEGNAGLKFTPAANLFSPGSTFSFQAQGATAADGSGASPAATATITVSPVADTPSVTGTTTNEDTQSTTGLVISRNAADGAEVTHFKITGITNGALFQNDGATAINNGDFITFAQGNAGLKFTPTANLFSSATTFKFTVQASTSGADGGLGGGTVDASITVTPIADTPSVTNSSTNEDTQTTTGLVISRNAADSTEVTHFKITSITNGTLFKNNGTTQINNNDFITFAEGNAGLKFTPTANFSGNGTFQVQGATSAAGAGLSSGFATATITVSSVADVPNVTNATTTEDTQTASGLVITPNAVDADVTHFKITNITNGTLFQNDGTTAISNNAFITAAQGAAGLKFTPNANLYSSVSTFSFQAQGATNGSGAGLGTAATATITVNPIADTPAVNPNPQTTAISTQTGAMVISRNAADGAEVTHFKITNITNGTLFQNDGTTPINNNDFITFAVGNAGLKFTPTAGLGSPGNTFGFDVQASTSNVNGGLGGSVVTESILVNVCSDPQVVTKTVDDGSAGTLRYAILNSCAGTGTITFNLPAGPQTITLVSSLAIGSTLTITGPTNQAVTINGGGNRVFDITAGSPSISNLTITGALVSGSNGGGLRNSGAGTITLTRMTFTGNSADNGGAVATTAGTINVTNSTISGNTATTDGGGLYCNGGIITFLNATVTNNTATAGQGGGLRVVSGTANVRNTILAGNNATTNANVGGIINDQGNNILAGNPKLAALANNGGPTRTHALLADSPALDAGDNTAAAALVTDQRGNTFGRFRDAANDADTTQTVDIGSFEADPSVEDITDKTTAEDTALPSFTFRVGDSFSAFDSITATSSNTTLVPNANITVGADTASTRSLSITPAANQSGTTTITVTVTKTVNSTALSMSDTFLLNVTPVADTPSVTNATTNEDTQSTSGLVISRNAVDGAEVTHFKITGITGGTLFKNNGTTQINNGDFITFAEGNAGLKFTPAANAHSPGTFGFTVQAATSSGGAGLSGSATASITVNSVADTPSVTNATTNEDTQSTSGLVISRNAVDGAEVTHFKITGITGGTLFKNNGTTQINNGDFITFAEGNAGLKFTPSANLSTPTTTFSFQVQAAQDAAGAGLSSGMATATITVNSVNDAPSFTKGPDQTVAENAGAQTVNGWATSLSKGPANESGQVLTFQITNNTNPALFLVAPAVSSTGTLTYTPGPNASGTAAITLVVKDDGGTGNGGVDTSAPQTFNITVNDGGLLQFSPNPVSVAENNGPAVVTITRVGGSAGTATVLISTSDGTATTAGDYTSLVNQLVTFNDGETNKLVSIPITDDLVHESTESFNAALSGVGGSAQLGAPTTATIIINDDDPVGGYLKFSSASYNVAEGSVATITVQRLGTLTQPVTVDFATSDNSTPAAPVSCAPTPGNTLASSRCDFTSTFGRITFGAGDGADKTFTVLTDQDNYVEGPETLTLTLSNVTGGATLTTPSTATLTIDDDLSEPATNPVDDTATFVEQLYRDFLNRPSDPAGKAFWVDNIDKCHDPARRLPGLTEAQCIEVQRINTAASFFLSIEFQATGGTAYLTNRAAFNSRPNFLTFETDAQAIGKGYVFGQPGSDAILEANKVAYFNEFVTRPPFMAIYDSMTQAQYVDALIANTGVSFTAAERDALVNGLNLATETRATVLRKITEKDSFKAAEFNTMFVQMEYIGFLRRDPDAAGFTFWLNKLNSFNGDYIAAEMIKAFISSDEYRQRFGP